MSLLLNQWRKQTAIGRGQFRKGKQCFSAWHNNISEIANSKRWLRRSNIERTIGPDTVCCLMWAPLMHMTKQLGTAVVALYEHFLCMVRVMPWTLFRSLFCILWHPSTAFLCFSYVLLKILFISLQRYYIQMDTNGVLTVQRLLIFEAHVLTDGLAGAESRMIGIIGLHHKAARERHFPLHLLEKGLQVKIEVTWRGIAKQVPSFDIVCAAGQSQLKCIFHGPLFRFIVLHGTYGICVYI